MSGMRRGATVVALCLVASGCPAMPKLRVEVRIPEPATVAVRQVDPAPPTALLTCSTPCEVALGELGTYEVSVRAPGYYPATMRLNYDQVLESRHASGGRDAVLVVPLRQRPASGPRPE